MNCCDTVSIDIEEVLKIVDKTILDEELEMGSQM